MNAPRPVLRVISFRRVVRGSLRGFCNIEWAAAGLRLHEVPIFVSGGKAWCGLPAAPVIDSQGRHHVINGQRQYRPLIEWTDRSRSDRFSERVVHLLLARFPGALDAADAA